MADAKLTQLAKALQDSVTTVQGTTSLELRQKVFERANSKVKGTVGPDLPDLHVLVDAVALQPHTADVTLLLKSGHSEDGVYEIVVTAAVGAGYGRVETALAAIEKVRG